MGRYSDINKGPELNDAYNKYQDWVKKPRAAKKAAYRAVAKTDRVKPERAEGYILPFNSDNDKVYLITKVLATAQTGAGASTATLARSLVDNRFRDTPPPSADGVQAFRSKNYGFAKIIVTTRIQTATAESESRTTGDTYKRHRTDNVSCPFGRKDGTDNYADALKEIRAKTAFQNHIKTTGNRIGFDTED